MFIQIMAAVSGDDQSSALALQGSDHCFQSVHGWPERKGHRWLPMVRPLMPCPSWLKPYAGTDIASGRFAVLDRSDLAVFFMVGGLVSCIQLPFFDSLLC